MLSKFNNKKHRRFTALLLCVALMLGSVTSVSADISAADSETEVQSGVQTYTEETTAEAVSYGAPEAQTEVQEEAPVAEETEAPAADTQQTETHTEAATEAHTETAAETQAAETTETEVETETETEVVAQQLEYEDDQVKVHVTASEEGIIPDHASLKVVPLVKQEVTNEMTDEQKQEVEAINKKYDEAEKKLTEKAEKEAYDIAGFLAYDISLVDADGNKVEPNGDIKVTMDYKQPVIAEDAVQTVNDTEWLNSTKDLDVTVLHLEEDNKGKVTDVVDMTAEDTNGDAEINTTSENEIQKVTITTNSFSTFAITYSNYSVTVKYVDQRGTEITSDQFTQNEVSIKKKTDIEISDVSDGGKFKIPETVTIDNKTYQYTGAYLDKVSGTSVYSVRVNGDGEWKYKEKSGGDDKKWNGGEGGTIYLVYQEQTQGQPTALPTVDTIDSTSKGITMRMINYSSPANGKSEDIGGPYTVGGVTGGIKQNLLKRVLTDGYPVTVGGTSLKTLFTGGTNVNHLFLQSSFDRDGSYEYSSFKNYAHLEDNGNFTVYDALGTPSNDNVRWYQRGNFMPYNSISASDVSTNTNLYDESGNPLSDTDSAYGKTLYKTQGTNDYYFGMYVEADFIQPSNGKLTKGSDMVYEFNGDDDLWVYVDGVLMLDIGGIHDAHSGSINFATGAITYDSVSGTTIKEQFQTAGVFPDGSPWDDSKVSEFFNGNTLKDFTSHNFKMFYMERGAGASNLKMKFNLEVVPQGTVAVEKQLTNTDKQKYSDVEFGFQVYAQEVKSTDLTSKVETYYDNKYVLLNDATYTKGSKTGEKVAFGTATYDDKKYENVFKLKPDEAVRFEGLQANRKYYVQEVGVQASQYDKITINGKDYVNEEGTPIDWSEGSATVVSRPYVICQNNCSAANSRELLITKQMASGQSTTDTFTFKIQLSDADKQLVPYAKGDYYLYNYQLNDKNENVKTYYCYDANGKLVSSGTTAIPCGKTDDEGKVFGVPVGYTVAITGILSSTNFKVTEEGLNDQLYQTPSITVTDCENATVEGADGTIKLGEDAKVTVTNSLKERLQVEKRWSGTEPNATVYVGLYRNGTATDRYKALNAENAFKGLFDGLGDGTYTVKELRAIQDGETAEFTIDGHGYIGLSDGDEVTFDDTKYKVIYGEKIQDNADQGLYKIQITNAAAWQLRKISSNSAGNTKLGLQDAEFTLVNGDTTIYAKSYEDGFVKFYTDKNFTTEVKYLIDGTYTVTEVKAPSGYAVNSTGWKITVANGTVAAVKEGNTSINGYMQNEVLTFDMTNTPIYSLPNSGGSGIYWFSICGMLLMMAAAWIIYKNKCREVLVK